MSPMIWNIIINLDEWCSTNKEKPTTERVPLKLYNDEKKKKKAWLHNNKKKCHMIYKQTL